MTSHVSRRQFLRGVGGGIGVAALGPLLSSCGGASGQGSKEIIWSRGDDLRTLDPQAIGGRMEGEIDRCVYDQLFDIDPDGKQIPWLATEWKANSAGTEWTVTMNEGAKFHDGSPLTSADVKFTYDRLINNPTFQHSTPFTGVLASVEAPSANTVVFKTAAAAPLFNLLLGEPILSQKSSEQNGEKFYEKMIGSGPYKHVEYKKGEYWLGEANRDYWKKELITADRLRYRPIAEEATRIAALRAGELHIIANVSGAQAEELGKDANIAIYRKPSLDHLYLLTQTNRAPFNNADARLAVNYAINRDSMVKNIVKAGELVGGPIPNGTLGYDASLKPMAYDPDQARKLLDKAGVKPGTKIAVRAHPEWFAKGKEVMEYIASALQEIGLTVDLQFLEPGAYTEARKAGNYDLALQQGGKSGNPGNQYKTFYITDTYGSGYNKLNPQIIDLIKQASSTIDTAQADTLYKQIQKTLYDESVEIQLYRQENIWAVRNNIGNYRPFSPDSTRPWEGLTMT